MKLVLEIDARGSLYFLLNALIGAYNRRTDVMAEESADKKAIQELTAKLRASNKELEAALPKEN